MLRSALLTLALLVAASSPSAAAAEQPGGDARPRALRPAAGPPHDAEDPPGADAREQDPRATVDAVAKSAFWIDGWHGSLTPELSTQSLMPGGYDAGMTARAAVELRAGYGFHLGGTPALVSARWRPAFAYETGYFGASSGIDPGALELGGSAPALYALAPAGFSLSPLVLLAAAVNDVGYSVRGAIGVRLDLARERFRLGAMLRSSATHSSQCECVDAVDALAVFGGEWHPGASFALGGFFAPSSRIYSEITGSAVRGGFGVEASTQLFARWDAHPNVALTAAMEDDGAIFALGGSSGPVFRAPYTFPNGTFSNAWTISLSLTLRSDGAIVPGWSEPSGFGALAPPRQYNIR